MSTPRLWLYQLNSKKVAMKTHTVMDIPRPAQIWKDQRSDSERSKINYQFVIRSNCPSASVILMKFNFISRLTKSPGDRVLSKFHKVSNKLPSLISFSTPGLQTKPKQSSRTRPFNANNCMDDLCCSTYTTAMHR